MLDHYANAPDTAGSTRHFDFAREIIKQGHRVSIFCSGFNHRTRKEERIKGKQIWRRENIDGVEFIWIKTSPYHKGNDWRRVVNMLSYSFCVIPVGIRLRETPDVILASSPHPFTGLAGYILAKIKGARFVFEVRDLWPQVFVDIGGYSNKSLVVKLLRVLEKFLYQKARKIVVTMPKASAYITRLGIPESKIAYIPQEVSLDLFSNPDARLPEELGKIVTGLKLEGKLLVGYTGAHGIADAPNTIVEAAKLLRDKGIDRVCFLLVGFGAEKEKLIRMARSWGLDNISFFEPIPKYAMPALLRAVDIAIITKKKADFYKYGISFLKLFDYMVCAKPIVWAVNSEDNPVSDVNCGIIVPPENPEAMATAIMELCDLSDEERQEMGMRGYEYVVKYHSVPVLASTLLKVLEY